MSSHFEFKNNSNANFNFSGGQGNTNTNNTNNAYNGPVFIHKNPKPSPVAFVFKHMCESDPDEITNCGVMALYDEIAAVASSSFRHKGLNDIKCCISGRDRIGAISDLFVRLLRTAANRNKYHQNKRGIFHKITSNYAAKKKTFKPIHNLTQYIEARYQPENDHENKEEKEILEEITNLKDEKEKEKEISENKSNYAPQKKEFETIYNKQEKEKEKELFTTNCNPAQRQPFVLKKGLLIHYPNDIIIIMQPENDIIDTLILCPFSEMAQKIFHQYERLMMSSSTSISNARVGCVYGTIPYSESKRVIEEEKPHILIGTPGVIVRLLDANIIDLNRLTRFIMDGCDNMLSAHAQLIDVRKQIESIYNRTPSNKQVMMFAETISDYTKIVCRKITKNDIDVYANKNNINVIESDIDHDDKQLVQYVVELSEIDKNKKLKDLLNALDFNQVVIFVKTKAKAIGVNSLLLQCAFPSVCIHFEMRRNERLSIFKAFAQYRYRILVSDDYYLFGEDIDVEKVNIVINYDMPEVSQQYLYKIGKCLGITFVSTAGECNIMKGLKERFINIRPLPDKIETSDYM